MITKGRFTQIFFTFLVCLAMLQTACPKKSQIDKAASASLQIANLTRDAIAATRRAYEENLISLETKDKMAAQLDLVIAGGQTFNNQVKEANERYKQTGTLELSTMQLLDTALTSQVVTPFLRFLELAGAVPKDKSPALWAAINLLRSSLLLIGNLLGNSTAKMLGEPASKEEKLAYENKIPFKEVQYVRKIC